MEGLINRQITPLLQEILKDTPVVVVQGPRQCGKSTLVQNNCDLPYSTLDDNLSLDSAERTPAAFLKSHPNGFIIDEIQRAPKLARSIKAHVDANRRPGTFVLTGSANILVLPKLADSLAGRMEVLSLWPFTQGEIRNLKEDFAQFALRTTPELPPQPPIDYQITLNSGGFPEPVSRNSERRQRAWFESYLKALIERDVRDLADIDGLTALPRLIRSLAQEPYSVVNITSLSRSTGIPATSLTRYLSLLEGVFLTKSISAYTAIQSGKAAKTSRLAFVDSGVLNSLHPNSNPISQAALENFVAMELVKQSGWSEVEYEIQHFRSVRQYSVPIVIVQPNGKTIGLTVINRPVAEPSDFRALQFLSDVAEPNFVRGYVLTTGTETQMYNDSLSAIPISAIWNH